MRSRALRVFNFPAALTDSDWLIKVCPANSNASHLSSSSVKIEQLKRNQGVTAVAGPARESQKSILLNIQIFQQLQRHKVTRRGAAVKGEHQV